MLFFIVASDASRTGTVARANASTSNALSLMFVSLGFLSCLDCRMRPRDAAARVPAQEGRIVTRQGRGPRTEGGGNADQNCRIGKSRAEGGGQRAEIRTSKSQPEPEISVSQVVNRVQK